MNLENNEKLIDLVRECTFLYDLRHPSYKDPVKKAEAWKGIAEKLDQNSDAVKQKWKNFRDTYVKYLKSLKGGTGSAKKLKNWPWAAHLEFLKDTVTARPSLSNIPEPHEPEAGYQEDEDTNDASSVTSDPVTQVTIANNDSLIPPPPKKTKAKKVIMGDVDKVLTFLQNKTAKKRNAELDRIDHLFLSYAETFKTLSPRTQAHVKMEMAQLFGRAELQDMDASSN